MTEDQIKQSAAAMQIRAAKETDPVVRNILARNAAELNKAAQTGTKTVKPLKGRFGNSSGHAA